MIALMVLNCEAVISDLSKSPQLFCDFTNFENFRQKKPRASVNRQLGAWARVTRQ